MPAEEPKTIECICDTCSARAPARVYMGAVSPPAGWFVLGRVALDHIVGAVEQWFYCSERCVKKSFSNWTEMNASADNAR